MNNKEKIVKKILFEIIDKLTKDADVYNHNGSLWLIKTDSTEWIFEFTESKTLWYNYNFFRIALKFVSLGINGKSQKYITEWFESRCLNINQVKRTENLPHNNPARIKDTIQNGVKDTKYNSTMPQLLVDDTIQNGVKNTCYAETCASGAVEDTIQNGVKNTEYRKWVFSDKVEDTIQNGVKGSTSLSASRKPQVEQTIQNGVKQTVWEKEIPITRVDDTIQNGVKQTQWSKNIPTIIVEDTIQNGFKKMIK